MAFTSGGSELMCAKKSSELCFNYDSNDDLSLSMSCQQNCELGGRDKGV